MQSTDFRKLRKDLNEGRKPKRRVQKVFLPRKTKQWIFCSSVFHKLLLSKRPRSHLVLQTVFSVLRIRALVIMQCNRAIFHLSNIRKCQQRSSLQFELILLVTLSDEHMHSDSSDVSSMGRVTKWFLSAYFFAFSAKLTIFYLRVVTR